MMINYWPMMINTNPFFHWITSPPSATFAQLPTFDHRHSPTITRHQLSEQPINHYLLKTKTFHQRNTQIHTENTNTHIFKYKTLFPLNHNASITRRKKTTYYHPTKKFWQKQEALINSTTSFFLQYSLITKIHSIIIHQCMEQPFSTNTKGEKYWCPDSGPQNFEDCTLSFLFWSCVTFLFIGECGDNKLYCPIVAQSKYIQQIWFFYPLDILFALNKHDVILYFHELLFSIWFIWWMHTLNKCHVNHASF